MTAAEFVVWALVVLGTVLVQLTVAGFWSDQGPRRRRAQSDTSMSMVDARDYVESMEYEETLRRLHEIEGDADRRLRELRRGGR
ncbi:MAG: hypothetical protein QG597_682 [Actinomycetota bacterium]|nr:hypothetical protein [Actinomycetota bacterium]